MKTSLKQRMTSAILLAGLAGMSPALHAADAPDAVSRLFADAKTHSSQISADWKSYSRLPNLNWSGSTAEVTHLNEEVNATTAAIKALNDLRKDASPSQIVSIDRIIPVLEEVAENTTRAIEFLSANQKHLSGKDYKAYLDASSDNSTRLSGIITQLVDYSSHKSRFDEAKRTLELASNK